MTHKELVTRLQALVNECKTDAPLVAAVLAYVRREAA